MKPTCIKGATVVTPGESAQVQTVVFTDKITSILPSDAKLPAGVEVIDGSGMTLTPGLVDLHTHGIGRHLYENGPEDMIEGLKIPTRFGCTSLTPTLYGKLGPTTLKDLEKLTKAMKDVHGIHVPGYHMEGPFLAITGAAGMTLEPDMGLLNELLAAADYRVSCMSVSPEKKGIIPIIERLTELKITTFLTHTAGTTDQTEKCLDAGATHATHFYDAFYAPPETDPGVRPTGIVEVMLGDPRATVDFICDGIHVHPWAVRAALAAKGKWGVVLITDSNIGTGLPEGIYKTAWEGGITVHVSPTGAARIHDPGTNTKTTNPAGQPRKGVLAGSSLTMDRGMRNLLNWLKAPQEVVWAMGSTNPARVIHMHDRGVMKAGAAADLVLWDSSTKPSRTWVNGEEVYNAATAKELV